MKVIERIEVRREPRSSNLSKGPRTEIVLSAIVEAPTQEELKEKMKIIHRLMNMVSWEVSTIE